MHSEEVVCFCPSGWIFSGDFKTHFNEIWYLGVGSKLKNVEQN
jgi:hypothetical protein